MVAYLDPGLYREFYTISKEQSGNDLSNKWEDYNLVIEKNIFDKIKQFMPINPNASKNSKGFRLSKNGIDTGIFQKRNHEGNFIRNNIEEDNQNDAEDPMD